MNKVPGISTGVKDVSKAINMAGGTSIHRSNVLKMGEASKASLVTPPSMKKASDDLLSQLTKGREEELAKFIQEKSAAWFRGSENAARVFRPKPVATSNLWHMGGGLAGAALGYSSARGDGQGVAGAMGVGAVGGLIGHHGGKAVGREHALLTAGARADAAVAHFEKYKQVQHDTGKMIDATHGHNAVAQHLIDKQKSLLHTPGQNFIETGSNMIKGGLAHAGEWLHNTANPGVSASDTYKHMVGNTKATHNITEAQGKFKETFDANEAATGHAARNREILAKGGITDMEARLGKHGVDPLAIMNNPNMFKNKHVAMVLRESGQHHNFYDVKQRGFGLFHTTTPKNNP